jgi:hypothetical protein
MSGQYIWKKFNIDWTKIDANVLTKDLSPRAEDTHFITDSFKKSSQEELKTKPKKAKKITPFINTESLASKLNVVHPNAQTQNHKLMDRYNTINSDAGIAGDNSASDRYTIKLKRMKKTIDAIHSFGKKISAGKTLKATTKTTISKDKSQEPKTIKKTSMAQKIDRNQVFHNSNKISEKTNTINTRKTAKPIKNNFLGVTNLHPQMHYLQNSHHYQQHQQKLSNQAGSRPQPNTATGNAIVPCLNLEIQHDQNSRMNNPSEIYPTSNDSSNVDRLKKMSNMEAIHHLSGVNQIQANRKELMSDQRSRLGIGHTKALASYDSKIGTHFSKTRNPAPTGAASKFCEKNSTLFKNATQNHNDVLQKHKKNAYLNVKSFREKDQRTSKKISIGGKGSEATDHKNKENLATHDINRLQSLLAIKSSINLMDENPNSNTKKNTTLTKPKKW